MTKWKKYRDSIYISSNSYEVGRVNNVIIREKTCNSYEVTYTDGYKVELLGRFPNITEAKEVALDTFRKGPPRYRGTGLWKPAKGVK